MDTTYNNKNANDYIIYPNSARNGYTLRTRDGVEIMQVTGSTLFKDLTPEAEEITPPEDTTAIEEMTHATAPQPTEENATPAPATDDATLLRNLIERYGNVGADYLDTLDYSEAIERISYDGYILGRAKDLKEIRYTIGPADKNGMYKTFGLKRKYARNGKRMGFYVHNERECIESRAYGKNNNHYKAVIYYNGNELKYLVKNGMVVEALLVEERGAIIHVHFNDTNRPETPRDLPAPAPTKTTSKETTKEEPATTEEEQPTSKPATAPTTEEVTAPEEVRPVTTSKQEDGPAPYWLLLDQELQAQQEEQEPETAPATPEATKQEEPMHAPQMLKKIIEEQKRRAAEGTNTIPLKTAVGMTTEVLTKKRAKELLGDDSSEYKTYILVDGKHVVRFDRPELSNTLYIDDESKEYKEYQRGNISAVELWRKDAMRLNDPARDLDKVKRLPKWLEVIRDKNNVLDFSMYGGRYGDRRATPDEVEIYKAAAAAASEAFTKRLDSYIRRYGKKIYVHSYWANR